MCYAGGCNPECDNCKPKYIFCPTCGAKNFLVRKTCTGCGYAFTEEDREGAREAWRKTHKSAL